MRRSRNARHAAPAIAPTAAPATPAAPVEAEVPADPTATASADAEPTAPSASEQSAITQIDAYVSKLIDLGLFSGALLVAQDGKVIYNKTYGMANGANKTPFTNQTQVYLGDLSMQFTSAAIVLLEQEGKLSVKDSVCRASNELSR